MHSRTQIGPVDLVVRNVGDSVEPVGVQGSMASLVYEAFETCFILVRSLMEGQVMTR